MFCAFWNVVVVILVKNLKETDQLEDWRTETMVLLKWILTEKEHEELYWIHWAHVGFMAISCQRDDKHSVSVKGVDYLSD
jgi:hypothetical protein